MWRHLASARRLSRPREFRLRFAPCPFCGPTLFVRLRAEAEGVRCVRCRAAPIHLALGWSLRDSIADVRRAAVCEFSAAGPVVAFLQREAKSVAVSEYFPGVPSGERVEGVTCEDMQDLSYGDASFDLVTHTEVLEHVPDDRKALAELARVLKPGGRMIFSVPLYGGVATVERARIVDGALVHLREPVYHADPLASKPILAFRDYGFDIVDRLETVGFGTVGIRTESRVPWIAPTSVISAYRRA